MLEIDFKENRRYFSEPDIIIKTRTKLIFCEIKLGSGNYNEKSLKEYNRIKAAKYISSDYFFNEEQAHASKCYELIRNWSVLNKMSKGEEVYLLNIGIDRIFDREDEKSYIKNFKSSIKNNTAFIRKKWCVDIVRKINKSDVDDWFYKEITKRFEKYFKK